MIKTFFRDQEVEQFVIRFVKQIFITAVYQFAIEAFDTTVT